MHATPASRSVALSAYGDPDRSIAIIGMAGRFPGASDVETFWRNLCDGVESITFFTPEELIEAGVPTPPWSTTRAYVRARPVLDDIAGFDAAFFGIARAWPR